MMNLERCRVPNSLQGPNGFREARIPEFDVSGNTVNDNDNGDQQGSFKFSLLFILLIISLGEHGFRILNFINYTILFHQSNLDVIFSRK